MFNALRMFLILTFLTGIAYPLFITGIAQIFMKQKADGNLVVFQNKEVGAKNIGQKFDSDKYFWGRPSFHNYDPMQSGGSNLGPTSAKLKKMVEERQQKILKSHPVDKKKIPAELLFASGSGLDPHISIETAYFQMERIARARKKQTKEIRDIIDRMIIHRSFGVLGEPCINVLLMNKELDEVFHGK